MDFGNQGVLEPIPPGYGKTAVLSSRRLHLVGRQTNEQLSKRKFFQFFTTEYDVRCGSVTYGLYYVEVCSSIPIFLRVFIINGC